MKYLGVITNKNKKQYVYAKWDGEQVKYIVENSEVAVYDPDVMEDPILFMNNTKANELSAQAKETIQKFAENININEIKEIEEKYGERKRKELSKVLGIEKKKIKSITEADLDQKVEESKRPKEQTKNIKQEKQFQNTKNVDIKQEIELNTMATDLKTLGQILQRAGKMPKVDGKNFTKLGIVESEDVKNVDGKVNTSEYSFVAIASDGTVVPVDLEQDYQEGTNPTEIGYQTRTDGAIEQDDVKCRFRTGFGDETLSISEPDGPGYIEIAYSPTKTLGGNGIEGNVSHDRQLETRNTYCWETRQDMLNSELLGYRQVEETYEEAMHESKSDKKDLKRGEKGITSAEYEDIDGDPNTKSHDHINIQEIAKQIENEHSEIADTFTTKEIEDRLKRELKEGKDVKQITEGLEFDAEMLKQR